MARAAIVACVALAIPAGAIAFAVSGLAGTVGALTGLSLVAGMHLISAAVAVGAGRFGGQAVAAAGFAGFALRLPLYLLALAAVWGLDAVHTPSLIATLAVAVVVTLAVELRVAATSPELFWLRTTTERNPA